MTARVYVNLPEGKWNDPLRRNFTEHRFELILGPNSPGGLLESTPVVLIDTLHLFPESYQHVNNVTKHYPKMILGLMGLS
jgi:3'-phosphoadenosine 5'-phosphosulfate sulfotransferase (PAPS reductase)/FAD synthetase